MSLSIHQTPAVAFEAVKDDGLTKRQKNGSSNLYRVTLKFDFGILSDFRDKLDVLYYVYFERGITIVILRKAFMRRC